MCRLVDLVTVADLLKNLSALEEGAFDCTEAVASEAIEAVPLRWTGQGRKRLRSWESKLRTLVIFFTAPSDTNAWSLLGEIHASTAPDTDATYVGTTPCITDEDEDHLASELQKGGLRRKTFIDGVRGSETCKVGWLTDEGGTVSVIDLLRSRCSGDWATKLPIMWKRTAGVRILN